MKKHLNNVRGQAVSLNNLAYLNYERAMNELPGDKRNTFLDQSISYAAQSLEISQKIKSYYTIRNSYGTLTRAYYALGNYNESLESQSRFMEVKDHIFSIEKQRMLDESEAQYRLEKKELLLDSYLKERKLEHARNSLILTIIIGLAVFAGFIAVFFVVKRRKDKEIFLKEKEIARIELEKKQEKEKELLLELDFKSKQLSTHAINMIRKNETLNEVKTDIKAVRNRVTGTALQELNHIISKISISRNMEKDWKLFRKYFEEVNSNFYAKLESASSGLSVNDKRICALIKLNMTSREISQVLNIAPNSLKSAKYRLKKRLELDPEVDMDNFIRNL